MDKNSHKKISNNVVVSNVDESGHSVRAKIEMVNHTKSIATDQYNPKNSVQ